MTDPIRVFIGAAAGGEDAEAQAVAEYTLRRHASRPVEVTWLTLKRGDGWNTSGWGTPFTGLRWSVPALAGGAGRAIYMDADVIVRGDVAELWDQAIPRGAFALVRGVGEEIRTCVMLLDCAHAVRCVPRLETMRRTRGLHDAMTAMLKVRPELSAPFAGLWNCVDLKGSAGIGDPAIRLIHYSSQWEQVHLAHAQARLAKHGLKHWFDGPTTAHRHPELQALFDAMLIEATAAGYPPEKYEPAQPYGPYRIRSYANRFAA